MRLKDLQPGQAYSKREGDMPLSLTMWGVVVSTERLYKDNDFGSIHSGKGVMVLTKHYGVNNGIKPAAIEEAVEYVRNMDSAPRYGNPTQFKRELASKGMEFKIWTPSQFRGTVEDVAAENHKQEEAAEQLKQKLRAEQGHLEAQLARIQEAMGIDVNPLVNMQERQVKFNVGAWKKFADRVEALVDADPMIDGKL